MLTLESVLLILILITMRTTKLVHSYQQGDRLLASIQTYHHGWKTPWMDLAIKNMPRFRNFDTSIVEVSLPHNGNDNTPEIPIDLSQDLKISLTFAAQRLLVPQVILFDSKEKKSLDQLVITFLHDKYDVLKIKSFDVKYGPNIQRLDPNHPSLTAFEIKYKWESVQEDDFPFAITVMFSTSLLIVLVITTYVWNSYNSNSFVSRKGLVKRNSWGSGMT